MISRFSRHHPDAQPRCRRTMDGLSGRPVSAPTRTRNIMSRPERRSNGSTKGLAMAGTDKSRILSAIVYIADIARKEEMNSAWDEWVDRANPPIRCRSGVALEPPHLVEIVVTAAQ